MSENFEGLLQNCTVRINLPNNLSWGTGFFITQDLILTCAHVVNSSNISTFNISNPKCDFRTTATIERVIEKYDVAILRIQSGMTDANKICVLFGSDFLSCDPLYLYGYPDNFPEGASVTCLCEGGAKDGELSLIKFKGGQIRPGISGAPLLNQRTGKVCGIVKFTHDRSTDLGGGAVPISLIEYEIREIISQQKLFHAQNNFWLRTLPISSHSFITSDMRESYIKNILGNKRFNQWGEEGYIDGAARSLTMNVTSYNLSNSGTRRDLIEVVEEYLILSKQILILGAPGSGKSTSLEKLAYIYACHGVNDYTSPIPILISLNRYTGSALFAIQIALNEISDISFSEDQTNTLVKNGRILFLLDGLNELGEKREEDLRVLSSFIKSNPQHYYVITCRTQDFHNELEIGESWEVQPLLEEDIESYLKIFLGSQGELLYEQIRKDTRLLTLASNPLMLRMIKDAGNNGILPTNRGKLYQNFVRDMLWREGQKGERTRSIPWQVKERALSHLAYKMQKDILIFCKERYIKDSFSNYLKDWDEPYNWRSILAELELNGLLYSVGTGWTFMHQSIQEFFAAYALEEDLSNTLGDVIGDPIWDEVLFILSGITEQSELLVNEFLSIDIFLAVKGIIQGATPTQELLLMVINKLGETSKDNNWTVRQRCANLMGELRSSLSHPYLSDLLKDDNSEVRWAAIHAIRSIGESGDIVNDLIPLLQDSFWVARGEAAMTLGELGKVSVLGHFGELLESTSAYGRICATYALVKLKVHPSTPGLQKLRTNIKKENNILIDFAIEAVDSDHYMEFLRQNLHSESPLVREASVMLLVRERSRNSNTSVAGLLNDKITSVRSTAVSALGKLQAKEFIQKIAMLALNDIEEEVRVSAVGALESIHSINTVSYLLKASEDLSSKVRTIAARSLGRLRSIESRPILIQLSQLDNDCNVRIHAIRSLGFIAMADDNAFLTSLLLNESDQEVMQSIHEAIRNTSRSIVSSS